MPKDHNGLELIARQHDFGRAIYAVTLANLTTRAVEPLAFARSDQTALGERHQGRPRTPQGRRV